MKAYIKSKLFGGVLSDGSFLFLPRSSHNGQKALTTKGVDLLNHPVWTGRKPKEQTEISAFIGRMGGGSLVKR